MAPASNPEGFELRMRQIAKETNKKTALERELTIAIQEADSSPQEGKFPMQCAP